MKKILSFLFLILFTSNVIADDLLFFSADYCSWCHKMKNETLSKPRIKGLLKKFKVKNHDFIKDRTLAMKYGITKIPGYVILDDEQNVKLYGYGFKTEEEFLKWADKNKGK